jgi:chemotaxis protein CheX
MMNPSYEDVAAITQHVLQTMAKLDSEPMAPPNGNSPRGLLGTIQIRGAWEGEIQVRTTEALAKHLAEQMLQIPPEELQEEDIKDVLAEVTNMIGGNIKSQLDSPSTLTLPSVALDTHGIESTSPCNGLLCDLVMECQNNPLSIQILTHS